ncbi:hypothetical protein KH5H1_01470 [Corallococcus caeni]|uniref:hypothetical protein n=1 Tax=Corallococcus caeni TaxID=3082388 RepID=UPI0029565EC5|nr:hypothetical protein KH5H1_01470 [Corallococcus sp. KH5-1]
MTHAYLTLNELSFRTTATAQQTGVQLLIALASTLKSIRQAVSQHDRQRIVIVVLDGIGAEILPDGNTISQSLRALTSQDRESANLIRDVLTSGPWHDKLGILYDSPKASDRASVTLGQNQSAGARVALDLDGMIVSLDLPQWRMTPLSAQVTTTSNTNRIEALDNIWHSAHPKAHFSKISNRIPLLPDYDDPGHHDPTHRNYNNEKSHIPIFASTILQYGIPANQNGSTWWALCEHGFFHRFQGSSQGNQMTVHWNGTTNPKATRPSLLEEVPSNIRSKLRNLSPARNCGCRELRD